MKHFIITLLFSGALLLTGCWQNGQPATLTPGGADGVAGDEVRETKYYKNGVFKTDGHIYSLFHSDDWILWMSGNRMIESSDLVHWLKMGKKAFNADEFQVTDTTGLDIVKIGDKYLMAYVAVDGSIGVAESSRIRGPYHNSRTLLAKSGKHSYGNPSFFCEGECRWLLWDTPQGISIGKFEWNDTDPKITDQKLIGGDGFHAPKIIGKNGMYYLWVTIRGAKGGIAVGRTKQLEGPYYTSDGISMESGGRLCPLSFLIQSSHASATGLMLSPTPITMTGLSIMRVRISPVS